MPKYTIEKNIDKNGTTVRVKKGKTAKEERVELILGLIFWGVVGCIVGVFS